MLSGRCDWTLICDGSNPDDPFGFMCTRCGEKEDLPTRLRVDVYLTWSKSFIDRHKECKIKPAPRPEGGENS